MEGGANERERGECRRHIDGAMRERALLQLVGQQDGCPPLTHCSGVIARLPVPGGGGGRGKVAVRCPELTGVQSFPGLLAPGE